MIVLKNTIVSSSWGNLADGRSVVKYRLTHANGLALEILNYGGIIQRLEVPDRLGNSTNIVLGYDGLNSYLEDQIYLGALIGRFANRIAKGAFTLNRQHYQLTKNLGSHHLHGGDAGFHQVLWQVTPEKTHNSVGLLLSHQSPHGAGGYPGNLNIQIRYRLSQDKRLEILYQASTDRKTAVNLTQHSYFHLGGNFQQNICRHQLQIDASSVLKTDLHGIPTGAFIPVENTPLDFRATNSLAIKSKTPFSYDHCYVLTTNETKLKRVAQLSDPLSGRKMTVWTDQPGMQLYIPQSLPKPFVPLGAICLETQNFPDAPNHSHFPSPWVSPEKPYQAETHYEFDF